MLFELCGLPGAGKTTLLKDFKNSHVKVVLTEDFYSFIKAKNKLKRAYILTLFVISHIRLILFSFVYVLRVCKLSIYTLKRLSSLYKYYSSLSYYIRYISKNSGSNHLIFDQGIFQYILSLSYEKSLSEDDNILIGKFLERVYKTFPIISIYYNVKAEVSAKRAINRKGDCAFDYYSIDKLLQAYEVIINNIQILKNTAKEHVYEFNTPSEIYDFIVSKSMTMQ